MALHVALTGGIACGKSTAEACFINEGCRVIDADQIVRDLEAPGGAAVAPILQHFGPTVRATDGGIDRVALAKIVFNDTHQRNILQDILYPLLDQAIQQWLKAEGPEDISIFSAALLFESGWDKRWPHIVCIAATPETQLRRMMTTRNMTRADAQARLNAQMPIAEKMQRAHTIIQNDDDDLSALQRQIKELVSTWRKSLSNEK